MQKKAIKITSLLISSLVFLVVSFAAMPVLADALGDAKAGLLTSGKTAGFNEGNTLTAQIATIINAALSFLGVIFVILMIYGGFLWMTARGDETQVTKAKDMITAAVIGLVVVISAYAISVFVVTKFSAGNLKT